MTLPIIGNGSLSDLGRQSKRIWQERIDNFVLPRGKGCLNSPLIALIIAGLALPAHAGGVDVLTQHYDNARSGANNGEHVLNTSNVNVDTFGKLFTRAVDGCIYAEPLVATGVKVEGHHRDIVYVATEHNSVYAFDAVAPAASTPIWQVNLGPSIPTSDYDGGPYGVYRDIAKEVGITGTPVIDRSTGTLFVVAKTKEQDGYHLRLHALDMTNGHERSGSPVEVTVTMNATGDGSKNGVLTLDAFKQLNRPGLLLLNGVVYITLGSLSDFPPYHGWVIGYDENSLKRLDYFNANPNGSDAGIWMSGNGPSVDSDGDIWVATGNGTFDADSGGPDYGDSFIRIDPKQGLKAVDWMAPHDQEQMNANDLDLGSCGPVYVSGADIIVGGSKTSKLFVLDPKHAGHFLPDHDASLQSFLICDKHIHGAPVYYSGPSGLTLYVWPEETTLKAFKIDGRHVDEQPVQQSRVRVPDGMPGGFLTISSDSGKPGTGIVWAMHSFSQDALHDTVPGIVDAFDASDLTHELWNSRQFADRDDVGQFAKHSSLTVANGRVYVPTFSNQLVVYGLLPKDKQGAPLQTPTPEQADTQVDNGKPDPLAIPLEP